MQPYTSGSTGKPKGVLLTHGGQIWNTDIMRKALMADDTERALIAVPLYHKNAMVGAVKPFLLAGGSLVILPGFDALEVIRAIDRYEVTYLTGVPAMYKMILAEKDALARHDVSSVRYAMCGSAEVPEELLEEFGRVFGAPIARELRADRGRAGADREHALGAQEARLLRPGLPGLRRAAGGRGRRGGGRGRGGRARHAQPGAGQGLLEAAGGDREEVPRRLARHRRPDAARRRRLLLLRRAAATT